MEREYPDPAQRYEDLHREQREEELDFERFYDDYDDNHKETNNG